MERYRVCGVGSAYLLPGLNLSDSAELQQGSIKHHNTVGLTAVVQ